MKESEIQKQIQEYLKEFEKYGVLCFRMHTQGIRQKRGYVCNPNKGMSDLLVCVAGQAFWIEVKTKEGKQSKEQKDFESKVLDNFMGYFIVDDLDSFIRVFHEFMIDDTKKPKKKQLN